MISKRGRFASIRGGILKCSFLNNQKCDHEVEKVVIDGDFDFDDDLGPHFSQYPNLKEFEVREKNSRFVSHDGILYMRLGEEVSNSNIGTYCRYNNIPNRYYLTVYKHKLSKIFTTSSTRK